LPFVVHSLSEKFKKLKREVPIFEWRGGDLKIKYEKMKL